MADFEFQNKRYANCIITHTNEHFNSMCMFHSIVNRIIGTQVQYKLSPEHEMKPENRIPSELKPWTFSQYIHASLALAKHYTQHSNSTNWSFALGMIQPVRCYWCCRCCFTLHSNYLVFCFNSFEMKFKLLWFHATEHKNSNSAIKLVHLIVLFIRQKGARKKNEMLR